jgi:dTDP-4-dehydrorhamnose 3,5-epimerase
MKVISTKLAGVVIIEPVVYKDARGFFLEVFHQRRYADAAGISSPFVQDNRSRSVKNTLRGLHFQQKKPQGKFVHATAGEIYDVVVDIQKTSPTFGQWVSVVLSGENFQQLYVPPGYAHGFCVLSASADVEYKCTEFYDPALETSLLWNDPALHIDWPIKTPILSKKDSEGKLLKDLLPLLS